MPSKKYKSRGKRGNSRYGSSKYVQSTNGLWKVALIVFAIVAFRVMELLDIRAFEFVRRLPDAWGVSDYNLNFLLLGVSLLGLILLLFSKASKSILNLVGGTLLLIPVWFRCEDFTGGIGARALSFNGLEPVALAFALGASLMCITLVHGTDMRYQLITGLIAAAEYAGLCLMDDFPIDWWQLVTVNAFAIGLGLAMDLAYNGFNASALLPVIPLVAEFMLRYADYGTQTSSMATLALCGAGLFALAIVPKLRRDSAGIAVALCDVAAGAAAILYLNSVSIL